MNTISYRTSVVAEQIEKIQRRFLWDQELVDAVMGILNSTEIIINKGRFGGFGLSKGTGFFQ